MQEVETKLVIKTNELIKSEKEKEEMDNYYNNRWVEEYQRVKNRLGREFSEKASDMESSFNERLKETLNNLTKAVE
ncbi:MAG: hypothetical protein KBD63_07975 [Bacteriovoracaceae bacterium]|nr:hypothetical protein [Bacteriovoracaceae bacterium]